MVHIPAMAAMWNYQRESIWSVPLVNIQKTIENGKMTIEMVDLPMTNGDVPQFLGCLPEVSKRNDPTEPWTYDHQTWI
jgi:hypothetical protein